MDTQPEPPGAEEPEPEHQPDEDRDEPEAQPEERFVDPADDTVTKVFEHGRHMGF